jgi:hypothetical protein
MITSPSRNDLATGFVRLHDAELPLKVVKVPTAPTAVTNHRGERPVKPRFPPGRYAVGANDGGR